MIYFKYKLNNGAAPRARFDPDISIGNCGPLADGFYLGYSFKSKFLDETFDDKNPEPEKEKELEVLRDKTATFTPKEIEKGQVVVITEAEAVAHCLAWGMNTPMVVPETGRIKDLNPPYVERRGVGYVRALEAEVTKTKPESTKQEKVDMKKEIPK